MHAQRIAVSVAAGAGMLATFLPWVRGPIIGSIDGTAGDGWITLAICAVALGCAVSGERDQPMSRSARTWSSIAGLGAGGLAVWKIVDFNAAMEGNPMGGAFTIGGGLYLLAIAGAAIAILPLLIGSASAAVPPQALPAPPTARCDGCRGPVFGTPARVLMNGEPRDVCQGCLSVLREDQARD